MCLCVRLCAFICSQAYVRITHKFRSPALSLIFMLTLHIVRCLLCFESLIIILYYLLRSLSTVSLILGPSITLQSSSASAFRQPSSTCRTTFPAQHLRPSGVLSCWFDGLELTPGFYSGSNERHRLFRRLLKMYSFARYYSASSGSTENARLGNTRPDLSVWRPWAGSLLEAPTNPQML